MLCKFVYVMNFCETEMNVSVTEIYVRENGYEKCIIRQVKLHVRIFVLCTIQALRYKVFDIITLWISSLAN